MFQTLQPNRTLWIGRLGIGLLLLLLAGILYSLLTIESFPDGYPTENDPGLGGDGFIYREAARLYLAEEPIYWVDQEWESQNPPYYMPAFFAMFSPLATLDNKTLFVGIWLALLLVGYLASISVWKTTFHLYRPGQLTPTLWTVILTLALLATYFWANLFYGNVVLLLVLLAAGSAYGIYKQNWALAGILIFLTFVTKPQWAFLPAAMLLVLLLERQFWGFVGRVVVLATALYIGVTALMMIQTSPEYVLEMIRDNVRFIAGTNANYPYSQGYSYNSSWQQMLHLQPIFEPIADYAPLIPLLWVGHFIWLLYQVKQRGIRFSSRPDLILLVGFAAYLVGQMQVTAFMDLILGVFIVGYLWLYDDPILKRPALTIAFVLLIITALTLALTDYIYIPYSMLLAILLYTLIARILKREAASLTPVPNSR